MSSSMPASSLTLGYASDSRKRRLEDSNTPRAKEGPPKKARTPNRLPTEGSPPSSPHWSRPHAPTRLSSSALPSSSLDTSLGRDEFRDIVVALLKNTKGDNDKVQDLTQYLTEVLVYSSDKILSGRSNIVLSSFHTSLTQVLSSKGILPERQDTVSPPHRASRNRLFSLRQGGNTDGCAGVDRTNLPASSGSSPVADEVPNPLQGVGDTPLPLSAVFDGSSPARYRTPSTIPISERPASPAQHSAGPASNAPSEAGDDTRLTGDEGSDMVVVNKLGTRSRKRRRLTTLDEASEVISRQPPLDTSADERLQPYMGPVYRQLVAALRASSSRPNQDFPEADLSNIGLILLADIFGRSGQDNVIHLIEECDQVRGKELRATVRHAEVVKELTDLGQHELASLVHDWVTVTSLLETNRSRIGRLFLLQKKVKVVRQWEQLKDLSGKEARRLSKFLDEQGFPHVERTKLDSRLGRYMARLLRLSKVRDLSDRIYRWKPLAVLVDTFGPGILALVPPTVEADYRRLSSTKGGLQKEEKFASAVSFLSEQYPSLGTICDLIDKNVVTPLISGENMKYNVVALNKRRRDTVSPVHSISLRRIVDIDMGDMREGEEEEEEEGGEEEEDEEGGEEEEGDEDGGEEGEG